MFFKITGASCLGPFCKNFCDYCLRSIISLEGTQNGPTVDVQRSGFRKNIFIHMYEEAGLVYVQ